MLNEMKDGKLKKTFQQLTYAPHFVSTVVVCSMTILFLSRDGLINRIIGFLGGEASNLMAKPSAFAPIFAITGLWQGLGWGTIIYLATLSGVSQELIEAARMDGASRMQIIWHVNLPHLNPTIITLFILQMGSMPVSYTHLDVYKRQALACGSEEIISDINTTKITGNKYGIYGDFVEIQYEYGDIIVDELGMLVSYSLLDYDCTEIDYDEDKIRTNILEIYHKLPLPQEYVLTSLINAGDYIEAYFSREITDGI